MLKINKLPENLIKLIAAGEVVERPASVVKELLENSIDAEADFIKVEIFEHGSKLIKITDNGVGIPADQINGALEIHATSKVRDSADLESLSSFGFRGEALASIKSVAGYFSLESFNQESEPVKVIINQENLDFITSSKANRGTQIEVRDIFQNIPARKKFLKSPATELKHIVDTFLNTTTPHLGIHFELHHNNKLLHRLPKAETFFERAINIFGHNRTDTFSEINNTEVEGLVGVPERSSEKAFVQSVYINKRYIKSNLIRSAIREAYKGLVHRDVNPNYIINITRPFKEVDVNVHPRKLEVKFTNEREVYSKVFRAIKSFLESKEKDKLTLNLESSRADIIAPASFEKQRNNTFANKKNKENLYKRPKRKTIKSALDFTGELLSEPAENTFIYEESTNSNAQYLNVKPFQILNTYIVFEKEDKLWFIDQHAAAEKIQFEKLLKGFGHMRTKPLLVPELIIFKNSNELNLVLEKKEDILKAGIVFEKADQKSINVLEIPEIIDSSNLNDFFFAILTENEEISNNYEVLGLEISKEIYLLLAELACHGSIRAGQRLFESEMKQIIKDVFKLETSLHCPHGRPIFWELSKSQIEKNFYRNL